MPTAAPPPLSPRDSALLSALIRSNFDLSQVAFDHGQALHDLTDWLRSPAIQALATDLLRSSQTLLEIRLTRARMATVGVLESIALTSDDPTERRRAAAALFHRPFSRRPYHPQPHRPRPLYDNPPPFTSAPSADNRASATHENGAAPPHDNGTAPPPSPTTTQARATPDPSSLHHLIIPPSAPTQDSGPQDSALPSPPHPLTSSPPHPPSSPSPLATALFHAFSQRNTTALLHAFSAHSTRDATLDGRPLLAVLPFHPLAQMHVSRECACTQQSRSDSAATYTYTFDRSPLTPARAAFSFEFTRSPSGHTACRSAGDWLIHRIDTLDSS